MCDMMCRVFSSRRRLVSNRYHGSAGTMVVVHTRSLPCMDLFRAKKYIALQFLNLDQGASVEESNIVEGVFLTTISY